MRRKNLQKPPETSKKDILERRNCDFFNIKIDDSTLNQLQFFFFFLLRKERLNSIFPVNKTVLCKKKSFKLTILIFTIKIVMILHLNVVFVN